MGLDARRSVADAISTAMLKEQGARAQALSDLLSRDARPQQSRPSNHPVRENRKLPDHLLHCPNPLFHCNS